MSDTITMYGADWCGDCRWSKRLLDGMGVDYDYIDVERIESAADEARAIPTEPTSPNPATPSYVQRSRHCSRLRLAA